MEKRCPRSALIPIATTAAIALAANPLFAQVPTSPEIRITPEGIGDGNDSVAITAVGAGGYLVVWDRGPEADEQIVARRLDTVARPTGSEFVIADVPDGKIATTVRMARGSDGTSRIVWTEAPPATPDTVDLLVQRVDEFGAPVGLPITAATSTNKLFFYRSAVDGLGNLLIVTNENSGSSDITGILVDAAGTVVRPEFTVNTYTTGGQGGPDAIGLPGGGFLVTWSQTASAGSEFGRDSMVMVLDASGVPSDPEQAVNLSVGLAPGLAPRAGGGYWLVANPGPMELDRFGLLFRPIGADGIPTGPQFKPIQPSTSPSTRAVASAGGQLLFPGGGGSLTEAIYGLRFDPTLTNVVSVDTERDGVDLDDGLHSRSAVIDDDGQFVVAWSAEYRGFAESGTNDGVFVRRFCDANDAGCDRCPDFDDAIDDDDDGIPNGCDPCTNIGGANEALSGAKMVRSASFFNIANYQDAAKSNRITLKAEFVLAGSVGPLAPDLEGAGIRIEKAIGREIARANLPPGAYPGAGGFGWRVNKSRTRFEFRDSTPSEVDGQPVLARDGFRRVRIIDKSNKQPGRVRVLAKAAGDSYVMGYRGLLPYRVIVTMGDPATSPGVCGEINFTPEECLQNRGVRCKR